MGRGIIFSEGSMEIVVDKEGREAVMQLLDVALKTGGIQNLPAIQIILNAIKDKDE